MTHSKNTKKKSKPKRRKKNYKKNYLRFYFVCLEVNKSPSNSQLTDGSALDMDVVQKYDAFIKQNTKINSTDRLCLSLRIGRSGTLF